MNRRHSAGASTKALEDQPFRAFLLSGAAEWPCARRVSMVAQPATERQPMHDTLPLLATTDFPPLRRRRLDTLQVNLGYRCNQSCLHCHVAASPQRTEMMDAANAALVLDVLRARGIGTLDLTGGAPELSPHFRELVRGARRLGVRVIDRCNLTILSEPGQEDLAAFLAGQGVEVTASLPCYSPANVDRQRGDGVFERSIAGLRQLNALGYGQAEGAAAGLVLNLVYNPQGASLPPAQGPLEADYKRELLAHFGIRFDHLFALANMPIQRFGSTLVSQGTFAAYMQLLRSARRDDNLATVMCRGMISVDWQGDLYDCDFNQMLGLRARVGGAARPHLRDLLAHDPEDEGIRVADHCYGCTAGQGSSCGGALDEAAAGRVTLPAAERPA
jgi:radical SAM/Cys-rich protein